jgi:hypothetical protein
MKVATRLFECMAHSSERSQGNGDSIDELHIEFGDWSSIVLFRPREKSSSSNQC